MVPFRRLHLLPHFHFLRKSQTWSKQLHLKVQVLEHQSILLSQYIHYYPLP